VSKKFVNYPCTVLFRFGLSCAVQFCFSSVPADSAFALTQIGSSYVVPIKQGQAYNATPTQVSACRARSRELQALLADYFLQRDKRELAGEVCFLPLP